jgi:hypothetical protein
MEYLYTQLSLDAGDIAEITLDTQANVLLIDAFNYSQYQRQGSFTYSGGWQNRSPVRLWASHPGIWYVVIDLAGSSGIIRHSVRGMQA